MFVFICRFCFFSIFLMIFIFFAIFNFIMCSFLSLLFFIFAKSICEWNINVMSSLFFEIIKNNVIALILFIRRFEWSYNLKLLNQLFFNFLCSHDLLNVQNVSWSLHDSYERKTTKTCSIFSFDVVMIKWKKNSKSFCIFNAFAWSNSTIATIRYRIY